MPTFYGAIDLSKNELRNAQMQNLSSAPSTPVLGQMYFNTSDQTLYYCTNVVGPIWTAAKAGAGVTPASTVTTETIGDAGQVGTGTNFAREDHRHPMPAFGATTAQTTYGGSSTPGSATTVAHSDHLHGTPPLTNTLPVNQAVGDASSVGVAADPARNDHRHGMPAFAAPTAETTFGASSGAGAATTLARADHTHGNPTHLAADHSTIPLNTFAQPTIAINFNSTKLMNVADPQSFNDAATKNYVDNLAAGLDVRASVRLASTVTVPGITYNATGGTSGRGQITTAPNTLDSITLVAGNRILLKDQSTGAQNGIYVVTTLGTGANGVWDRATDFDSDVEVTAGAFVFIEEGTVNADTGWVLATNNPITIGGASGTALVWTQFSSAAAITAGAGLLKTGNTIDLVNSDASLVVAADEVHVNTANIATVASLAGYAPTTRTITAGNGLTGGGDLSANRSLAVGQGTGILSTAGQVAVDTSVIATVASQAPYTGVSPATGTGVARKYVGNVTGTASPEVITHNLNTRDVQVTVLNGASPYTAVEIDWDATTVNTVTIRYNPNLGAGYRAVVVG